VISAFAIGFDIAAVLLFAAAACGFALYERVVGAPFRVAQAQTHLILAGGTMFALVNAAAVAELLVEVGSGGHVPGGAGMPVLPGSVTAVVAAVLAWRYARREADRRFDAQLVRLTED
jgi:hypothetical protein